MKAMMKGKSAFFGTMKMGRGKGGKQPKSLQRGGAAGGTFGTYGNLMMMMSAMQAKKKKRQQARTSSGGRFDLT